MKMSDIRETIFEGDKVLDRMDNNSVREIARFQTHDDGNVSVFMTDGGVIGLDEIHWNDAEPSLAIFETRSI